MLEFELLQVTVGRRKVLSHIPSKEEWEALYSFANKQSLVSAMFLGIESLPKKQRPPLDWVMKWYGQTQVTTQHNELQNQRCKELTEIFQRGGFRTCILKGQGTALLYPKPQYRQCGDIDIWVDGKIEDVIDFVKEKGISMPHIDIKHADVFFFEDVPVEVHFTPSYSYNFYIGRRLSNWILSKADRQFTHLDTDLGFAYPTVDFNLVYSLLHIYRHLFSEGIGLRQVLDYYYILLSSKAEERAEGYLTICQLGMKRFVGALMYVLKKVFDMDNNFLLAPIDEKDGKFLLKEIMIAGNFGKYDNRTSKIDKEKRFKRTRVRDKRD